MLYLISLMSYTNRDINNFEAIRMLKIGYTGEESYKGRMNSYRFSTEIKEIAKIPGGTREDEVKVHQLFSRFRVRGNEFYSYEQEIIDFFSENNTIEKMREVLPDVITPIMRWRLEQLFKPIFYLLEHHGLETRKVTQRLLGEVICQGINNVDSLFNYLSKAYGNEEIKPIKEQYLLYQEDIVNNLKCFNDFRTYDEKMKYMCELKDKLDDLLYTVLLNVIPKGFSKFILILGPKRCAAFSYRRSLLQEQLNKIDTNAGKEDILKSNILATFEVGKRYVNKVIKFKVGEIYKKINYIKTPKANDLDKWFVTKSCLLTDPKTKKRIRGLLIVSIKSS